MRKQTTGLAFILAIFVSVFPERQDLALLVYRLGLLLLRGAVGVLAVSRGYPAGGGRKGESERAKGNKLTIDFVCACFFYGDGGGASENTGASAAASLGDEAPRLRV